MQDSINNNMNNQYIMYLRKSRKDLEAEKYGEGETLAKHEKMLTTLYESMGISSKQIKIMREIVTRR